MYDFNKPASVQILNQSCSLDASFGFFSVQWKSSISHIDLIYSLYIIIINENSHNIVFQWEMHNFTSEASSMMSYYQEKLFWYNLVLCPVRVSGRGSGHNCSLILLTASTGWKNPPTSPNPTSAEIYRSESLLSSSWRGELQSKHFGNNCLKSWNTRQRMCQCSDWWQGTSSAISSR